MKIVIAPQAFKGSIGALDAAKAAEQGALKAFPKAEVIICPVADGGDGTLETLVEGSLGQIKSITVTGPTGRQTEAEWGAMGDERTAVIEMARSSGLALLKLEELDPLNATTYGLGEIISEALSQGFRKLIQDYGLSITEVGLLVGKSRPYISNSLRLSLFIYLAVFSAASVLSILYSSSGNSSRCFSKRASTS